MGAIILKTKNKVTNLDAMKGNDAYAYAYLLDFDILNYKYTVVYKAEVEITDEDGNTIVDYQTVPKGRKGGSIDPAEIQTLFDLTGSDIAQGENFDTEMRAIITTAFIYKVGQDAHFGLDSNDWEVVT